VPYLTPNTAPATTSCRVLSIPDDPDIVAIVTGAFEELTFVYNFEKYGSLTPQQTAALFVPMFDAFCFQQGVCHVIGEVILYAGTSNPSANLLPCDGASLLRTSYPDLFAAIGTTYGFADGSHFNLPDLQSRSVIGVGTGSGLSTYNLGDQGGEETHVLSVAELANHGHSDSGHAHTEGSTIPTLITIGAGAPAAAAVGTPSVTGIGNATITNTGSDSPHNNIQPYTALQFYIIAL